MRYSSPYFEDFITDPYGTAVGVINFEANSKVVIEDHTDDKSWYVNKITDDGFIFVIKNGSNDYQIVPSKRVNIHISSPI